MQTSLLRAKLHRPTSATVTIPRDRLIQRLQAGLAGKVTLVSAVAGSGKSTLLSAWLDRLAIQPAIPQTPLTIKGSWLTLDKSDDLLPRFLRYLLAAIEASFPQSCLAVSGLLQTNPDPPLEAVADTLTNSLALLPGYLVLVLDDLHQLDDPAISAFLARLVQYAPPSLHLVLSTRVDPPLPLNRWRAQPYLAQIHCDVVTTLADRCQRLGKFEIGLSFMESAWEQTGNWPPMARGRLLAARATMHLHNANLLAAERDFQASLHLAQQHGLRVVVAVNHFGLGMIAGARHQLDQAETHYLAVLADPQLYNGRYAVGSLIRLLYIYTFQGRPERARPLVDRVKEQAQLLGLRYLHDHVAALEAYLAMACGDLPRALSWVMSGLDDPLDTTMYNAADRIPVTRIRILLAEGSPASLHNANQILRKLIRYQESQHYRYFLGEVFVLQALVWAKLGRQEVALGALSEAVQRLLPNGVIGLFLEQGEPMRRLLYELSKQGHYRQLVDLLLAAFPTAEQVAPIAPGEGVITPLTDREQDVLYLLADRLSNKEIADRLVISVNTVRNHRMNILSKLQAHNRLEAVERARALGLLPLR